MENRKTLRIVIVGCIFSCFVLCSCNHEKSYAQKQKEYAELDARLRQYCDNKIKELLLKDYMHVDYEKRLDGRMIALIRNDTYGTTELEYRLNDELKKHNQFTTNPDSIDYVVLLLPHWETDYYGPSKNSSCSTEMADAYVLDYKANRIVKTVKFDENKNPFVLTVRSRSKYSSVEAKRCLEGEELYNGIVGNMQKTDKTTMDEESTIEVIE